MRILKWMLSAFVILAINLTTNLDIKAQQQRPPQSRQMQMPKIDPNKMMEDQLSWFTKNLNITEEQTTKIKTLQESEVAKRKEVMESGLTPRDENFRERMQVIDTQRDEELSKILTSDQWNIFEKKKEEFMAIGRPKRPTRN